MIQNSAKAFWEKFNIEEVCRLLEKGLFLFVIYELLLVLARGIFVGWLGLGDGYLESVAGSSDILQAMWIGGRLSIQTAGILMVVTMIPSLPFRFAGEKAWQKAAKVMSGICITLMSVMFVASFPYYRQFHSRFHQLLFNTANDDVYALGISLIQEFYLPVRLAVAFMLAAVLCKIIWRIWLGDTLFTAFKWLRLAVLVAAYHFLSILVIFGGSLGWETAVDWENAGVTRSEFLNEAILDDFQAVYRGYRMNGRFRACNGLNFTTEQIRTLAAYRAGMNPDTDNLDVYLTKQTAGAQIPRPKQIFVIISESYANWPLLPEYEYLHIGDGVKGIIAGEDADYCPTFLPNGSSTVSAVTGVVTGLADANLYLTTMPESFAAPYPTAGAPYMEQLGYTTNFWYAGPATWERIGAFTQGQGFSHFYGVGDMPAEATGSVWGCDDEYLYASVLERTPADIDSFNVILNVSNHSPYNLDLAGKGFDEEKLKAALPDEYRNDSDLIRQLGHYWYADREMADFVSKIKEKYPDSLIVIMGDHGDRYNLEKTPSMYNRYGVPFIITGKGVHKGLLLPNSAGSQIDVVPTILEMIAPQGFTYESIGSSLTRNNTMGVNYGFWITRHSIGEADTYPLVHNSIDGVEEALNDGELTAYIDAVRSMSWWRPKYGPILDENILIEIGR